jgi:hypothetical protein
MAVLENQKHEQFVQNLLKGLSATRSYELVYGEAKGAQQSAARLLLKQDERLRSFPEMKIRSPASLYFQQLAMYFRKNAVVRARLSELQTEVSAEVVRLEISDRNARVSALQELFDRQRRLIASTR